MLMCKHYVSGYDLVMDQETQQLKEKLDKWFDQGLFPMPTETDILEMAMEHIMWERQQERGSESESSEWLTLSATGSTVYPESTDAASTITVSSDTTVITVSSDTTVITVSST